MRSDSFHPKPPHSRTKSFRRPPGFRHKPHACNPFPPGRRRGLPHPHPRTDTAARRCTISRHENGLHCACEFYTHTHTHTHADVRSRCNRFLIRALDLLLFWRGFLARLQVPHLDRLIRPPAEKSRLPSPDSARVLKTSPVCPRRTRTKVPLELFRSVRNQR
jgi:hypothetical protein